MAWNMIDLQNQYPANVFQIKQLQGQNIQRQIILGNSSHIFIAFMNCLLLREPVIDLPGPDNITSIEIIEILRKKSKFQKYNKYYPLVDDFDNNIDYKFSSTKDFIDDRVCYLSKDLKIKIYHGMIPNENHYDLYQAISQKKFSDVQSSLEEISHNRTSWDHDLKAIVNKFLMSGGLTPKGFAGINNDLLEGEFAVFFASRHYFTITKYGEDIYLLLNQPSYRHLNVIWQKFNFESDPELFGPDFQVSNNLYPVGWRKNRNTTFENGIKNYVISLPRKLKQTFAPKVYRLLDRLDFQFFINNAPAGMSFDQHVLVEYVIEIIREMFVNEDLDFHGNDYVQYIKSQVNLTIDLSPWFELLMESFFKWRFFGAGCIIFNTSRKKVLLVKSRKFQKYSFPKGYIEKGETRPAAAIRETFEECGLQAQEIGDFDIQRFVDVETNYGWYRLYIIRAGVTIRITDLQEHPVGESEVDS